MRCCVIHSSRRRAVQPMQKKTEKTADEQKKKTFTLKKPSEFFAFTRLHGDPSLCPSSSNQWQQKTKNKNRSLISIPSSLVVILATVQQQQKPNTDWMLWNWMNTTNAEIDRMLWFLLRIPSHSLTHTTDGNIVKIQKIRFVHTECSAHEVLWILLLCLIYTLNSRSLKSQSANQPANWKIAIHKNL